ncbi:outer membrane lipoprotein carrier protein LolA [Sporosarcina sp. OR05]|uniref:LolA family protein n=1 Tax=Sporosarcina sp. OR05 TaxID=2969819 RepID=UPI00352BAF6F
MKIWIKPMIAVSFLLFFAVGLAACNTEHNKFSPQEVVNAALKGADEQIDFYGEFTMKTNDDEGDYYGKQWVAKDGKRRIEMASVDGTEETIAVNDGTNMTMYDKASNTASVMAMTQDDMQLISQQTPQQQAKKLLELVKDSHDLSTVGSEKIAGRDTFHISAKAKKENTLIGDQEIWVDKETWMVLKSISKSTDLVMTQEFTKVEYDLEFEEGIFTLEIPEGAAVETFDEESMAPKEATLEEVKAELGTFHMVAETDEMKLSSLTVMEGMEGRPEFSFDYTDEEGIPLFSISVFKDLSNTVDFGATAKEEQITIRGQKGSKMESGNFRLLNWVEDGVVYSVILENPTIEFDEMIEHLEEMKLVE